jgi:long-subunit fatty acid transport protein
MHTILRTLLITLLCCFTLAQPTAAKPYSTAIIPVGSGSSAFAMANNAVALTNDLSAVLHNPASLSFTPIREFGMGFELSSQQASTDFLDSTTKSEISRLRLAHIGVLHAVPTTQGGLSFAGLYHTPYLFDESYAYKSSEPYRGITYSFDKIYKVHGALRYWSGAFGVQVAPGLGVGATVSLVRGSDETHETYTELTDTFVVDATDDLIKRDYLGYDVRFGVLYSLADRWRFGARFELPQSIGFDEQGRRSFTLEQDIDDQSLVNTGHLRSSYRAAGGVMVTLPSVTISADARGRFPYQYALPGENVPESSPASSFKVGAGAGVEVAIPNSAFTFRLGYSWDEYDPYVFVFEYDDQPIRWDEQNIIVKGDRNLITTGLSFVSGQMHLGLSYGYRFWSLETVDIVDNFTTDYSHHQGAISLSLRY